MDTAQQVRMWVRVTPANSKRNTCSMCGETAQRTVNSMECCICPACISRAVLLLATENQQSLAVAVNMRDKRERAMDDYKFRDTVDYMLCNVNDTSTVEKMWKRLLTDRAKLRAWAQEVVDANNGDICWHCEFEWCRHESDCVIKRGEKLLKEVDGETGS